MSAPAGVDATVARRAPALALVPACLVGATVLLLTLASGYFDRGWSGGIFGIQGSTYTGRIARNLDRHGFVAMRFGAPLRVLPSEPPLVEQYLNHPTSWFLLQGLLYRHGGRSAAPLKWMAAVMYLLMGPAVVLALAGARPLVAATAGALAAGVPFGARWGFMVATHGPCLLATLLSLAAFLRWRLEGRRAYLVLFLIATVVGCQFDWWGFFVFPALALQLLAFERGPAWRACAGVVLLALLNLLLIWAHRAWIVASPGEALRGILDLFRARDASAAPLSEEPARWHVAQARFLVDGMTLPGLVLAGIGVVLGAARGGGRRLLLLLALGLPNLYLFAGHASDHPFWPMTLLPFLAAGAAFGLEPLLSSRRRALRVAGLLLLLVVLIAGVDAARRSEMETRVSAPRQVAAYLNRFADGDDVVLSSLDLTESEFYLRCSALGGVTGIDRVDWLLEKLATRRLSGRVLFVDLAASPVAPIKLRAGLDARHPRRRRGALMVWRLH